MFEMARVSAGAVALLALAASAAVASSPSVDAGWGKVERLIKPEVGSISEREVGDTLVAAEIARHEPGVQLTNGPQIKGPIGSRIVYSSTELRGRQGRNGTLFCAPAMMYPKLSFPVEIPQHCLTEGGLQKAGAQFTPVEITMIDAANFRQELIYQGRSGTSIRISYREFSGDLARPAFTQDLTFDISEDRVIGAKGARVEILDATNTSVRYRLLQPFGILAQP